MPPIRTRKMNYVTSLFAVGASAFFVAGAATSPALAAPSSNSGSDKMAVCHLTRSQLHPYQYQEVAMSSLASYHVEGKYPGDIFPSFSYVDKGNITTVAGQNWTTANQAIYAAGCVVATPSPTPSVTPVTTPSSDPTSQVSSDDPTSQAPTDDPTTQAPTTGPTDDPTSQAPTDDPTSQAPTDDPTTQAPTDDPTTQAPTTGPTSSASPSGTPSASTSPAPVTSEAPGQGNTGQGSSVTPARVQSEQPSQSTNAGQPIQPLQPVQPIQAVQPVQPVQPVQSVPSEVSISAQTAAGAPAPDYTTSNALFASGALMLVGAFVPKLAGRRRGRHS